MTGDSRDRGDGSGCYASPPCLMHELDAEALGFVPEPDAQTRADVTPDVVIAPLVGFDAACYRLGYGGGYYDRTLAALAPRPRVIGVGAARATLPTIYPQPYDIPMDAIVNERESIRRDPPQTC